MNDKERILMSVLERLYFTQVLCLRGDQESKFRDSVDRREYVHFGAYDDRPIQKGDLVLAQTGRVSDWKIAWVHEVVSFDTCILREIGSNRLCNWGNEKFIRIVGVDSSVLLEQDQYIFQQKVIKAFSKGNEYLYRFGGVEFPQDGVAMVWIREAFGGIGKPSKPFSFEMKYNKKTSVKKILESMISNGYGTKEFEKLEDNKP